MAKKAYVGINGIARNVSNIYVGVNGVARKVVKGYVGVNGVARQFWGAESIPASWDYWTTVQNQVLMNFGSSAITKTNGGIAYYGYCYWEGNAYNTPGYYVIAVSTTLDACGFGISNPPSGMNAVSGSAGTIYGTNWYSRSNISKGFSEKPDEDYLYFGKFSGSTINDAVLALINKVYAVEYLEDYQSGSAYTFDVFADKRRSLRKALGVFLFENLSLYGSNATYTTFSDSIDTIINTVLNGVGNHDAIIIEIMWWRNSNNRIIMYVNHGSMVIRDVVYKRAGQYGFTELWTANFFNVYTDQEYVDVYNGALNMFSTTDSGYHYIYFGIEAGVGSLTAVYSSNMGIKI